MIAITKGEINKIKNTIILNRGCLLLYKLTATASLNINGVPQEAIFCFPKIEVICAWLRCGKSIGYLHGGCQQGAHTTLVCCIYFNESFIAADGFFKFT